MSKKITLLDGGLGQEIHKRSGQPAHPMWSAEVMRQKPEIAEEVHRDFLKAGARVITINSYSLTPTRLKRDATIDDFQPLQRKAIELAQKATRDYPDAQIAGCLPPLIGSYTTDERSNDSLEAEYREIIALQNDAVDLYLIETISSLREGMAALRAAKETGKPVLLSFTLTDDGSKQIRSGESIDEVVRSVNEASPDALLFNCSFPESIGAGIAHIEKEIKVPFGGYANAFTSIEALKPGGTVDALEKRQDLTEESYAEKVMTWIDHGATILGGCCEVGPSYIAKLREKLEEQGYETGGF